MTELNKGNLYVDKDGEFYIGYNPAEECWVLVSIPNLARIIIGDVSIAGRDDESTGEPVKASHVREMYEQGVVLAYDSTMGHGTWSMIGELIGEQIAIVAKEMSGYGV